MLALLSPSGLLDSRLFADQSREAGEGAERSRARESAEKMRQKELYADTPVPPLTRQQRRAAKAHPGSTAG